MHAEKEIEEEFDPKIEVAQVKIDEEEQLRAEAIERAAEWTGKKKFPVNIRTLGTTGTIKKARKKYLDKLILYPLKSSKKK